MCDENEVFEQPHPSIRRARLCVKDGELIVRYSDGVEAKPSTVFSEDAVRVGCITVEHAAAGILFERLHASQVATLPTTAKWTPAPWFLFGNGHCVGGPANTPEGTGGVAMCGMRVRTSEEIAANAALIVTAPEMADVLRSMVDDKDFLGLCQEIGTEPEWLKKARALLLRAAQ